ncbi:alpha/beta fold hydrolase [Kitasatospora camelliae]|uniref:Alpha/beta hydrolase n=1 Tax=Kitasatospora camelliae TaxID=3156397 RepID=A0AAU8JRM9_9ACTN
MTPPGTTGTLDVPGATLHYEVRGSGPVLLLIPGGAGDAGMYTGLTAALADRHTVIGYDQRGLSRSRIHGEAGTADGRPTGEQRVTEWSEDVSRLLHALAPGEQATVVGCSSGAIVALDLLARHPEQVRRVVAHEPPLVDLLPDPAPHRALFAEVREIFRRSGVGPAMARFSEGLGGRQDDRPTELPPELAEFAPRMHANLPVFLEQVLCPFSSGRPDLDRLRPVADRLVLAVGRESRGQVPLYGPAERLAELLDCRLAEFPGGHLGATERPREFAEQLEKEIA